MTKEKFIKQQIEIAAPTVTTLLSDFNISPMRKQITGITVGILLLGITGCVNKSKELDYGESPTNYENEVKQKMVTDFGYKPDAGIELKISKPRNFALIKDKSPGILVQGKLVEAIAFKVNQSGEKEYTASGCFLYKNGKLVTDVSYDAKEYAMRTLNIYDRDRLKRIEDAEKLAKCIADFNEWPKSGTAIIKGQAFCKTRGGDVKYAAGNQVYLVPETTYGKEWAANCLSKNTIQPIDDKFQKFFIKTTANGTGEFSLKDIPSGNYTVVTSVFWETFSTERKVYTKPAYRVHGMIIPEEVNVHDTTSSHDEGSVITCSVKAESGKTSEIIVQ